MSTPAKKTYFDMAKEAIAALKERTGSSSQAIKAYIVSKYPACDFKQHLLRATLKKAVTAEKFIMVKASYKLSAAEKKPPKKKAKKSTSQKAEPPPPRTPATRRSGRAPPRRSCSRQHTRSLFAVRRDI